MDLGNDDVGEGAFVVDVDEDKDVRLAETGVGLFDAGQFLERLHDVLGLARLNFDENISSGCHLYAPFDNPVACLASVVCTR